MANLSADGTKILNNYDRYSGVPFNAVKTTTWLDGTTMDDTKVDNTIYFKNLPELGGGYSRRELDGEVIHAEWFGIVPSIDGLTNVVNNTDKLLQALSFASAYNGVLSFNFGYYAIDETCLDNKCRIKGIVTNNSNLGEATNSKKATFIPWRDNQRYILKLGGKADLSALPDLETYSCKGLQLQMNFSTLSNTASTKTVTDSCLILESFTSGDLTIGFYDVNGRAFRVKNCWETRIRSLALRRIDNFGGEQWLCDDARFDLGANTSELVVDNITSGESNCTILRNTSLSFFTKININSVVFEHNSAKFGNTNIPTPNKAQLDAATSIPLFDFGYSNGIMMNNINLCGLNKNLPVRAGTNYKYTIFNISGPSNITADINVSDGNSTVYLTDGIGHEDAIINCKLTVGQYNRTTAASITDPLVVVNLMTDGSVKYDAVIDRQDIKAKQYTGSELLSILDQNYTNSHPNFKTQRSGGLEYAIKVLLTGQTFLRGNTYKGRRAKILIYTSAISVTARKINGASQVDTAYTVVPNTWTVLDIDLYDFATASNQFRLLTPLATDDVRIQWISFYDTDSTIYRGSLGQRIGDPQKFYFNTTTTPRLQYNNAGTWLDVLTVPDGTNTLPSLNITGALNLGTLNIANAPSLNSETAKILGNLAIDGVLRVYDTNPNPSAPTSSMTLDFLSNQGRIRIEGSGPAASKGLQVQITGNQVILGITNAGNLGVGSKAPNPLARLDLPSGNSTTPGIILGPSLTTVPIAFSLEPDNNYLYFTNSVGVRLPLVPNVMTSSGDLIIGGTTGIPTRLGIGSNGQVLGVVAGVPTWTSSSGTGTVTAFTFTNSGGFTGTVTNSTTTPTLSLVLQDAGAAQSGQVNTGTQTFGGNKTINGTLTVNGTTSSQAIISGVAGNVRDLVIQTAGIARWTFRGEATAEGGSNAGTNLALIARDDSGTTLSTPLFITRSNGNITIGSNTPSLYKTEIVSPGTNGYLKAANFIVDGSGVVTSPTPTTGDSSTKVATTAFVTAAIAAGGGSGITLTTTGTSGAATLSGGVLNIPNYATGGGGGGTSNRLTSFYTTVNAPTTSGDILSYTIPGNTFVTNGGVLNAEYYGFFAAGGSTMQLAVVFAGTTIFNYPSSGSVGGAVDVKVRIYKTGTSTARYQVFMFISGSSVAPLRFLNSGDLSGIDFTTSNILKVTGAATASGDLQLLNGQIIYND